MPVSLDATLSGHCSTLRGSQSDNSAWALLELGADGSRCVVEFDRSSVAVLTQHLAGDSKAHLAVVHLRKVELAAIGHLLLTLLASLRNLGDVERKYRPRLVGVYDSSEFPFERLSSDESLLSWDIDCSMGGSHATLRLFAPSRRFELLAHQVEQVLPGELDATVAAAKLSASLLVGSCVLPSHELGALEAGDVALVGDAAWVAGQLHSHATIRLRTATAKGVLRGRDFSCERIHLSLNHTQETTMRDADEVTQLTEAVPVELCIELTRLLLPISELATLRPGAIMPLAINVTQPVTLRLGDRTVARAELVDIEGQVGARILTMTPRRGS